MPRNGSGVYTLPAGNPVVPGTTIDAAWANSTLNDIANELTNSLSRTGAGGMIAPFRIADGNITAPGLSFLNETGSGLYRSGAGSVWMSILGTNTMQFATTAVTVASSRTLNALGNALVGGTLGVTGATTIASTLAVTGALSATGGVLGNITAASGTSTFHDVLINGSLDMAVGSSATITGLSTPTNASDAANKGYVDTQDALRLALTGGTMSGAIAMGANKITGLGTPSADTDAANKAYVDSVAQGLDIKASVRAATTTNISLSGAQTIDGVAVIAGDRVLVKNQSSAADNGIYVASASTWARASDANTWDKLVGAFTFVEDGSTNDNSGWVCAIAPGGTLGVTAVTWEQFSGAGQINAGAGLTKTGNTLNVGTASSARIVVGADEIDLAQTGVSAGTYKSVTVDLFGRVTAGTNPTTLAGYGITDAYTNTQTDTLLNGKLSLTGGTMTGALAMGTNRITGMGDPVNAQDAATKNYIDTIFGSTASAAASAAAAASSASAASTSASNASTSASNASSSASAAAASAASAAASYDSFDDRYLGAKSSDPTVDNDGNALITGALYWNTVGNIMKTWTGTAWVSSINPISMPDGTVNGVAYLNGSKVLTTSSGFTYDGSSLTMSSSSSYYPQIVTRNKANDNTATYYGFDKDRNGAVVQNGDVLGNLVFRGYDGTQYLQGAYINAVVNATPGANDMPGALCFGVTPDGSAGPSEGMRLTSTGLGVGTSSPAQKLDVRGAVGAVYVNSTTGTNQAQLQLNNSGGDFYFALENSAGNNFNTGAAYAGVIWRSGANPICFVNNNTLRATLDSSGNLGLGVTPSAWATLGPVIQMGSYGAYIAAQSNSEIVRVGSNNYYNAGFKYVTNGYASFYSQSVGEHIWYTAPSGTAGNAISFTQAMTLDASGNLGINSTSPSTFGKVTVQVAGTTTPTNLTNVGPSSINLYAANNGSSTNSTTGIFGWNSTTGLGSGIGFSRENSGDWGTQIRFYTHPTTTSNIGDITERARITSGGLFFVGVTSQQGGGSHCIQAGTGVNALQVQNNGATPYGPYINFSAAAPNNTGSYFFQCTDTAATRTILYANGGLANYQANDVNLSDRREKTNFAPAKDYLDTICAIPVQTFNYIDQSENDPGLTLGVVAQDVQAVAPELVMESNWGTKEDPKMRLSIYQTDLQYALMKALQELKAEFDAYKATHP